MSSTFSKYKCWKVAGLYPWSALLFTAGFATRTAAAFGYWDNLDLFIASTVLLLAAPYGTFSQLSNHSQY